MTDAELAEADMKFITLKKKIIHPVFDSGTSGKGKGLIQPIINPLIDEFILKFKKNIKNDSKRLQVNKLMPSCSKTLDLEKRKRLWTDLYACKISDLKLLEDHFSKMETDKHEEKLKLTENLIALNKLQEKSTRFTTYI